METSTFSRDADKVMNEEERINLAAYLSSNPVAGDVIPGLKGIRKLRWAISGKGKSGGLRIIYYVYNPKSGPLYLLKLYQKSQQADLSPTEKKRLAHFIETLEAE